MKKAFIIILALSFILLSACTASDSSESSDPSAIDIPDTSQTGSVSQTDSENSLGNQDQAEESQNSKPVSDRDEKTEGENQTGTPEGTKDEEAKKPSATEHPKETIPSQSSGNDDSKESSKPTESTTPPETKPTEDSTPQTKPTESETKPEETQPPEETETPAEPNAGASDTYAVAEKVLEYINQYRSSPATRLSGLTGYAQYRSGQLVYNFAHDTGDQRAAATALQYGEYVDPTLFGGTGDPYYRANAREAIAKAGYAGTVDEVAEKLASLVKNSPNHWNYIGSSEYSYIAVGVTYDSGMWYCAITVTSENTDEC